MLRISLSRALPARPQRLAANDLAHVFGGCNPAGSSCSKDADCCPSNEAWTGYGCGSNKVCFTFSTSY